MASIRANARIHKVVRTKNSSWAGVCKLYLAGEGKTAENV